jgi:hypothetical protein
LCFLGRFLARSIHRFRGDCLCRPLFLVPAILGVAAISGVAAIPGAAILGAGDAAAAEAPAPVVAAHLEVQAAVGCATRDELAARVAVRSPRIRFLEDDAAEARATALRASIAPGANGGVVGELVVLDPDGRRSSRRLSAPTCAEAIDALALIIVITLDPRYVAAPALELEQGPRPAGPAPRASPQQPADEVRPPARASARQFEAGAAGMLISGPAPGLMTGLAVRVFAALNRTAGRRASIWSPAVRLTAAHAWRSGIDEPGGTAAFALDVLSLDVCPIRLPVAAVDLRACAAAMAGRLSAAGSDTYSPSSQERPFVSLGGSAILSVTLGPHLELSGGFGAGDAPIRDSFEFSPQVFHRVSALIWAADLGLGLRFP